MHPLIVWIFLALIGVLSSFLIPKLHVRRGSSSIVLHASKDNAIFTKHDIEAYALESNLLLKSMVAGPVLTIEAYPAGSDTDDKDARVGFLQAFLRPFPLGVFHLDTIQVKNRRQNLGYKRSEGGWTIDGPGISFIMGSWALRWAHEKGCRRAELLAVKDSELMHRTLVKLYESFGFRTMREVDYSVTDRLVWGAEGTLMELDMSAFFKEWTPKLASLRAIAVSQK